jgi:hypothetical protein
VKLDLLASRFRFLDEEAGDNAVEDTDDADECEGKGEGATKTCANCETLITGDGSFVGS